jgi:predicted nuclease of predicted toxin-antitoxin system
MKIKLDENIPLRAQAVLQQLGHDVDIVIQENLAGSSDNRVWQATQEADRFLITQDLDFADIQRFPPGSHAGVLVMRLGASGREALLLRLRQVFLTEDVEIWSGCLVIISERKIRIRRPLR